MKPITGLVSSEPSVSDIKTPNVALLRIMPTHRARTYHTGNGQKDRNTKVYPQRIGIIEPVFANIRVHKRMDKFNLRGKIKINIQWLLYCMAHNIEKKLPIKVLHKL